MHSEISAGFIRLVATIALLVFFACDGFAQQRSLDDGFRSPSGNIHCQHFHWISTLRCDLKQISGRPLPRPSKCDMEFGQAFEVFGKKPFAGPICHGDTVLSDELPVLPYGERWARGDFVCQSERTGVSCRNLLGAGFDLSRATQRVVGHKPV